MRKLKKLSFLLLLILLASGWSPVQMLPAFKNLQTDITTQLSALFDREISVGSVSGTLINQVELNDVCIAKGKKAFRGIHNQGKKDRH